jgi:4,5-DOPA dioxygenase extradiol
MSLPAIFVSHGAPTLPFDDVPARDFLRGLSGQIAKDHGRPRAILIASAHWETQTPQANGVAVNDTIHDFGGFPQALYDIRYPAPGAAALAQEVAALTGGRVDTVRGLDHGAWVPLMLMVPDADIPVVQVSVQSHLGAGHAIAMGRAVAKLRDDNVLVMGSGGFVHNLRRIAPPGSPEADWSKEFSSWMDEKLNARDEAALADYRSLAPHAIMAHPTEEHFLPLPFAYGAGGEKVTRLHSSATFGSLRMDAYSFG